MCTRDTCIQIAEAVRRDVHIVEGSRDAKRLEDSFDLRTEADRPQRPGARYILAAALSHLVIVVERRPARGVPWWLALTELPHVEYPQAQVRLPGVTTRLRSIRSGNRELIASLKDHRLEANGASGLDVSSDDRPSRRTRWHEGSYVVGRSLRREEENGQDEQ